MIARNIDKVVLSGSFTEANKCLRLWNRHVGDINLLHNREVDYSMVSDRIQYILLTEIPWLQFLQPILIN